MYLNALTCQIHKTAVLNTDLIYEINIDITHFTNILNTRIYRIDTLILIIGNSFIH